MLVSHNQNEISKGLQILKLRIYFSTTQGGFLHRAWGERLQKLRGYNLYIQTHPKKRNNFRPLMLSLFSE